MANLGKPGAAQTGMAGGKLGFWIGSGQRAETKGERGTDKWGRHQLQNSVNDLQSPACLRLESGEC
jgi:hypothetical protein